MSPSFVITERLSVIFLALTPIERWEAARQFDNTGFMGGRWFLLIGLVILGVLSILLIIVSYNRRTKERKSSENLFNEYAEKRGLSDGESQILIQVAQNAGLKRIESIFTIGSAFDRGATVIIEDSFAKHDIEQGKRLRAELAFLREKLGFQKQHPASVASMMSTKQLSSRQISTGKKLFIHHRGGKALGEVTSTVIKSDDMEITVKLDSVVDFNPGEPLCVNYYFGISAWEFDTSVVRCDGDLLILNHSDEIRFINRRRFLRVPVNKPAYLAHFPFRKVITLRSKNIENKEEEERGISREVSDQVWGSPEFIPGVITELAGPGLRIKTPLELKAGDKVLVVFKLNEIKEQDLRSEDEQSEEIRTLVVIEDLGEVKHIATLEDGFLVAVELVGLNDSNLNELIRATNSASLNVNGKNHSEGVSEAEENVHKPAGIHGG